MQLLDLTQRSFRRTVIFSVLALGAFAAPAAHADDLTAEQRKWLGEAVAGLKRAQTNFRMAEGSVPTGDKPLTGSRLKLALSRLESAKAPMPQVAERLAQLPSDNPKVKECQAQYDDLKSALDALETRITGQAPVAADADAGGVKLDYRQEEELKNAQFALRDLEGQAAAVAKLVEEIKPQEDQRLVDHRTVQKGMNTIDVAERRIGEVHTHLDPLPDDGRGVQPTRERLGKAVDSVAASKAFLAPLHEQLSTLINPASYPNLRPDLERLRELAMMYANPTVLIENRAQAAEIIKQVSAAEAERQRLVKKYALLIHQQTEDGKRIEGVSNGFTKNLKAFAAAAKEQQAALPGQIREHLAEVRRIADEAVQEQKPLFFTGGIPQTLGFAEEKLALLETLDADAAKRLKDELAKTRADLKVKQDALRETIVNANELPADNYAGADRKTLEELAAKIWKKQQPDAEILTIRFPAQNWKHEVRWEYSNGTWYKIDRSKLQAQVILKYNDRLAVNQPVNLRMDHLSNDALSGFPFRTLDEELLPHAFILLEKVK